MTPHTAKTPMRQFNPLAALLAWVWPGWGHIYLGHVKRGWLIMFGLLFLFISGLLIGGFDCVDRKEDHLWFLAQSVNGPIAFAVDFINQEWIKTLPNEKRLLTVGLNKPNEMGTLFCALGGLMNFMVILDVLYFHPKPLPERRASS